MSICLFLGLCLRSTSLWLIVVIVKTRIVSMAGRASVAGKIRWVWLRPQLGYCCLGVPLLFHCNWKIHVQYFPFPSLSLDRIRDTRITIMTRRGGVVTGRRLPMRKREERWTPREMRIMWPLLDHKRWSQMDRKIAGLEISDFHKIYNNSQTMTTIYILKET